MTQAFLFAIQYSTIPCSDHQKKKATDGVLTHPSLLLTGGVSRDVRSSALIAVIYIFFSLFKEWTMERGKREKKKATKQEREKGGVHVLIMKHRSIARFHPDQGLYIGPALGRDE
jgi:hypothetical protein